MSERKTIVHKAIMVAALMLSVAALRFSIKVCHAAIIIVIITWFFEGQRLNNKLSIIKHSLFLQVIMALIFLHVMGLAFSDEGALELPNGIIFYSLFSALLFFQLNSFQKISFNFRLLIYGRD